MQWLSSLRDGLAKTRNNLTGHLNALLDTLKDGGPDATHVIESSEVKSTLAAAVESLPPQERTVISLYYFEGLTLKEIKNVLEVSESRVSQIHAQAVIRLRSKLRTLQSDMGIREGDPTIKQKYVRKKPQTPPGAHTAHPPHSHTRTPRAASG